MCYIFNHVDAGTSWSFGVLEYNHVNRVHYFEYFCPGTPCLIRYLLYRFYIDYHKLLSLLHASQVYFFNYGSKSFRPLELKGVNRQQKQVVPSAWPAAPTYIHTYILYLFIHGAGASIKGCFATASTVKGRLQRALSPVSAQQMCHADEA